MNVLTKPETDHQAVPGSPRAVSTPLVGELEQTVTSYLQPLAFFISWHGVLTLAYRGFTPALLDLKRRLALAHPALSAEAPGSKWPKTSIACLKEGTTLTPEQFQTLRALCKEVSDALFGPDAAPLKVAVDSAAVTLYENRCQEKLICVHNTPFNGGHDGEDAAPDEQERVQRIVAESDHPDYYALASKEGNREAHYTGPALGAALVHQIPMAMGKGGPVSGFTSMRAGLRERGFQELADRRRLLLGIQQFRERVEAAVPGAYRWFDEASLHVTLRAIIL